VGKENDMWELEVACMHACGRYFRVTGHKTRRYLALGDATEQLFSPFLVCGPPNGDATGDTLKPERGARAKNQSSRTPKFFFLPVRVKELSDAPKTNPTHSHCGYNHRRPIGSSHANEQR
jgi:hypothetical protein